MCNIIAVTNRKLTDRPFLEQLKRVCCRHPKALILREKDLTEKEYENLAKEVLEICRENQVPCILHSWPGAARRLGCTSIHLPLPLLEKYSGQLEGFSEIGTSVHSLEEAKKAQDLGATYMTAGHIFATDCKKGLPPRGLDFLRQVCQSADIPVYAIGGIKPQKEQLGQIMACGASGGCVMSGMMRL